MKYSSIITMAAVMAAATGLSSCGDNGIGCIRGSGVTITETRQVEDFSELEIQTSATITVVEDSVFSFTATGQENILQNLLVSIRNGKMILKDRRCVRGISKLTIEIHAPLIRGVAINGSSRTTLYKNNSTKISNANFSVNGSGKIMVSGAVNADQSKLSINGSGDIELPLQTWGCNMNITGSGHIICYGNAHQNDGDINGSGRIEAYDLETENSDIEISGSGRADVHAENTLDVNISGSGSVHYKGWPQLTTRISGSGKVVHEN